MSYSLKHQYGHLNNYGVSYSGFAEFKYKPLVSFGAELGGYNFEFDKNQSTNLFIKPTIIFNGNIGRSTIGIYTGISFDVSVDHKIKTSYNDYYLPRESGDTSIVQEKAFFYNSFASFVIGASYSIRITKNLHIGGKLEASASQGGFYKGYESNFKRAGLFVKYKF